MAGSIDQLIVNAPYEEPERHWRYDREGQDVTLEAGRARRLARVARVVGDPAASGGFGHWRWAVSRAPSDIMDLVRAAAQ